MNFCKIPARGLLKRHQSFVAELVINQVRSLSLTHNLCGQKNFRKFHLGNKRGTRIFKKMRNEGAFPDMPIETEVKPVGYYYGKNFIPVPEMVPEFIVPDLTDCQLKPYVSYRAPDVYQTEFTTKDLFDAVYKQKIENDFESKKLDSDGKPLEPSLAEKLTPEEAFFAARKVGNDLFSERIPKRWECLEKSLLEVKQPKECE